MKFGTVDVGNKGQFVRLWGDLVWISDFSQIKISSQNLADDSPLYKLLRLLWQGHSHLFHMSAGPPGVVLKSLLVIEMLTVTDRNFY